MIPQPAISLVMKGLGYGTIVQELLCTKTYLLAPGHNCARMRFQCALFEDPGLVPKIEVSTVLTDSEAALFWKCLICSCPSQLLYINK